MAEALAVRDKALAEALAVRDKALSEVRTATGKAEAEASAAYGKAMAEAMAAREKAVATDEARARDEAWLAYVKHKLRIINEKDPNEVGPVVQNARAEAIEKARIESIDVYKKSVAEAKAKARVIYKSEMVKAMSILKSALIKTSVASSNALAEIFDVYNEIARDAGAVYDKAKEVERRAASYLAWTEAEKNKGK